MKKFASWIVRFRKYILMVFIALAGYSIWGWTQTKVEYELSNYLPETTDTYRALDIMDDQFYTFGSTYVMVKNVSYEEAEDLSDQIADIDGVKSTEFHNTEDYYKDSCAKIHVTFEGSDDSDDPETLAAFRAMKDVLGDHEYYMTTDYDDNYVETLTTSINLVLILAVVIIIIVLLITSESFMEVPVFLLTFGMAALLNMGTNYWFGTISFVSNSVAVILQLALSIDYAIILANRYQEEKAKNPDSIEAMTEALSKAITEISGSSLTTISGLIALCTMSYRLGADLGLVLSKSILFSMFTVFFFMPALLIAFDKPITKTMHKSLVPKVSGIGKFAKHTRYVTPIVFLAFCGYCFYCNTQIDYCYDQDSIDSSHVSASQKANQEIESVFGSENQFAIVMPGNDHDMQADILEMVEEEPGTSKVQGLANTEITSNDVTYTLTQKVNYKEFARFLGVSNSVSDQLYRSYAYLSKDESRASTEEVAVYELDKIDYRVSLLDICDLAFEHDDTIQAALSHRDDDALDEYNDVKEQIQDAEKQLVGTEWSRIVFNIDTGRETDETFALISDLETKIKSKYPDVIFAGNSMADYDTHASFSTDNLKVSLFTLLFIFIILIFTFNNWFLPIPLCLAIEGAIFINFSFPVWTGTNMFFIVYLIVSSIQMGATIDYAIVTTNRYMDLRKKMEKTDAMTQAINEAFPTIVTSGSIMIFAALLIGILVEDPLISSLGYALCRGVVISILSALFVLPSMLLDCDKIFDHTQMRVKTPKIKNPLKGLHSSRTPKGPRPAYATSGASEEAATETIAQPVETAETKEEVSNAPEEKTSSVDNQDVGGNSNEKTN